MQWWARLPGATQDPHWRHRWNKFGSKESGRLRGTADKYSTNCSWLVAINRSDILVNPSNFWIFKNQEPIHLPSTILIQYVYHQIISSCKWFNRNQQAQSGWLSWSWSKSATHASSPFTLDRCQVTGSTFRHQQHFFVTNSTFWWLISGFLHRAL